MDFDFALLLVVLTAVTGIIWLFDRLFFHKGRVARAQAMGALGGSQREREQRVTEAMREPAIVEYARSFFPVILIVLLFRSFIAEPFKIPSGSMMPTLLVGDFVLVNKFAYGLRLPVLNKKFFEVGEPKRGDVFVFVYPGYACERDGKPVRSGSRCGYPVTPVPKMNYIKRVIGLPGDTITYRNKTLYVNDKEIPQNDVGPFGGPFRSGDPNACDMQGSEIKQELLPAVEHRILNMPTQNGAEGTFQVPAGQYFAMGDNRDCSEDSRYWGFVPEQNLVGRAFVIWMNWDSGIDFKRLGTLIK
ncbi:MAG TPA: signal peptidase I [Rudaea sp.]|jgi:signal peptidase I|uniref:signal peptidase I n=1 Tax=Rudaea sp. TaxID=2136325 RepID=UPI002F93AA86